MIQPKYNPKEALERAKLLMNYDSKKTLSENKVKLFEVIPIVAWAVGSAVVAALTAAGITASEWSSASSEQKVKTLCQLCDKSSEAAIKRKTMRQEERVEVAGMLRAAFDYSILFTGKGTDLDKLREALQTLKTKGNFGDFCEVRKLFSSSKLEDEFVSELNTSELNEVATALEYLIAKSAPETEMETRNEETGVRAWWLDTFSCLEDTRSLASNFQIYTDGYGNTMVPVKFKIKGVVKDFWVDWKGRVLIGSSPTETKQTGKTVVCNGSKVTLSESVKKKQVFREQAEFDFDIEIQDDEGGGGGGDTPPVPPPYRERFCPNGYQSCSGTYTKCCSSPKIAEAQTCLGLTPDGKWGPKTQAKISTAFPQFATSFTDADISAICSGSSPVLKPDPVKGVVNQINVLDTDF